MPKLINIGIPIDVEKLVDTRLLIQAGSGGGKSYLLRKTIESIGNQVQQIILDPEGEYVTLREKFDFVLIGKDGDIPLNLKYAETLAHKLLETGLSAIIDLYELKHYERILFVKRFLDALINAPKELWHSCLIYIDEAHLFCPEGAKSESASSVIDLCTRGRKRGYAAVLATQRLSKLNKDAAAECLNKMIGQTGLDNDRKRAGEELGLYDKASILNLRNLEPGEFYTFGPAVSKEVIKFKVAPVVTTHLRSGKRMVANPPTPNAVKKILSKLADIPAEAEKELISKQQLQGEVTRLRGELTKMTNANLSGKNKKDDVEISHLKLQVSDLAEKNKKMQDSLSDMSKKIHESNKIMDFYKDQITRIRAEAAKVHNILPAGPSGEQRKVPSPEKTQSTGYAETVRKKLIVTSTTAPMPGTYGSAGKGEMIILAACAQYAPVGLKREAITVITGYKRSSRDTYIQRLKQSDLICQVGERLISTVKGYDTLGPDFKKLPTGEALQHHYMQTLAKGEAAILEVAIRHYPNSVTRDILTEQTGYIRSSRDTYLQRMISKEIIVVTGKGEVKASDNLFD